MNMLDNYLVFKTHIGVWSKSSFPTFQLWGCKPYPAIPKSRGWDVATAVAALSRESIEHTACSTSRTHRGQIRRKRRRGLRKLGKDGNLMFDSTWCFDPSPSEARVSVGYIGQQTQRWLLIFEWLCFKEATSVFAYLLKIGWVTHEKIIWKVPQLLLVVLIPETLNMTSGQRFKLLRSGVPRSMYREKLVITVWFIVSSNMLHFCWHRQSCIDSTKSVSHLVVSWQSLVLVSSDIPLSMYMDMSQNEVSFLGPKWLP